MGDPGKQVQVRIRDLSRSLAKASDDTTSFDTSTWISTPGKRSPCAAGAVSGKSTLLNLICGIDAPDGGSIEVAGQSITNMSERERTVFRRRHIGFVYQAFNLVSTLSVADNIMLVLELNGVGAPAAARRVSQLLGAVSLADRADSFPDVLSGGEQQRIAIARALAHEPDVVLADEPTGNLDDTTAEQVMALLETLVRDEGRTMVIATHSTSVAAAADRTLELHDGSIRQ